MIISTSARLNAFRYCLVLLQQNAQKNTTKRIATSQQHGLCKGNLRAGTTACNHEHPQHKFNLLKSTHTHRAPLIAVWSAFVLTYIGRTWSMQQRIANDVR